MRLSGPRIDVMYEFSSSRAGDELVLGCQDCAHLGMEGPVLNDSPGRNTEAVIRTVCVYMRYVLWC